MGPPGTPVEPPQGAPRGTPRGAPTGTLQGTPQGTPRDAVWGTIWWSVLGTILGVIKFLHGPRPTHTGRPQNLRKSYPKGAAVRNTQMKSLKSVQKRLSINPE